MQSELGGVHPCVRVRRLCAVSVNRVMFHNHQRLCLALSSGPFMSSAWQRVRLGGMAWMAWMMEEWMGEGATERFVP